MVMEKSWNMEHEKLPKSHGKLLSVMEFYQCCKMQNREERWSWKSHGQIFCQICVNPDLGIISRTMRDYPHVAYWSYTHANTHTHVHTHTHTVMVEDKMVVTESL